MSVEDQNANGRSKRVYNFWPFTSLVVPNRKNGNNDPQTLEALVTER